jgi:hypothetical protein
MRFQVLTAASMKMTVFWDVTPCCLVETDRRFRGSFCLRHQGDEEAASTSKTSVDLKSCLLIDLSLLLLLSGSYLDDIVINPDNVSLFMEPAKAFSSIACTVF